MFVRNHNENWYNCRFWTTFLDKCISTIDGSYISRYVLFVDVWFMGRFLDHCFEFVYTIAKILPHSGETKSISTSNRKNCRPPVQGKRRRVGHLYDGVVVINALEVGVVEHGRQFIGENGRKWSTDTLKVLKVLHDMIYQLQSHVDSPAALGRLQVVGLVTAGKCYITTLCRGVGVRAHDIKYALRHLLSYGDFTDRHECNRVALPTVTHVLRERPYMYPLGG